MTKLVLIDGNAIMHRAYHALPNTLTSKSGEPINAVYGLTTMLLRIIEDLQPTHIAFCFDRREPTFRHKQFTAYQSHRPEMDDELGLQFAIAKRVIESFDIKTFDKAGYEADDLIGTIAKLAMKNSIDDVIIVTGDKDQMQLVNDKTKLFMPIGSLSSGKLFGKKEVVEKMHVRPDQIVDYKALVGDPSDNYPGIYGIGPKTAVTLLAEFGSYDNLWEYVDNHKEDKKGKVGKTVLAKLQANRKSGDISYKLAKIITDLDVKIDFKKLSKWEIGSKKNLEVFDEIGFKTLTRRVKGEKDFAVNKKPNINQIEKVAVKIAKVFTNRKYAIRGTASLVLQGLDMGVDDIDVLCDKKTALVANNLLKDYLKEKVEYKESDKYKSYFGKFVIDEILVEVCGDWQIKKVDGRQETVDSWGKTYNASDNEITTIEVNGQKVRVTKIETELDVSAAMGRWKEYHKIKKQFDRLNQGKLF